jgi:hypothetical protein
MLDAALRTILDQILAALGGAGTANIEARLRFFA